MAERPDRLWARLPFSARDALFERKIPALRPSACGAFETGPSNADVALLYGAALRQSDAKFNGEELAAMRHFLSRALADLSRVVERSVWVVRLGEEPWILDDDPSGLAIGIDCRYPGLWDQTAEPDWMGRPWRVSYTAEPPAFLRGTAPHPDCYAIREALTTRPVAFAAQREWRVLGLDDSMPLPAAAITDLIVGANAPAAETAILLGRLRADPAFGHLRVVVS